MEGVEIASEAVEVFDDIDNERARRERLLRIPVQLPASHDSVSRITEQGSIVSSGNQLSDTTDGELSISISVAGADGTVVTRANRCVVDYYDEDYEAQQRGIVSRQTRIKKTRRKVTHLRSKPKPIKETTRNSLTLGQSPLYSESPFMYGQHLPALTDLSDEVSEREQLLSTGASRRQSSSNDSGNNPAKPTTSPSSDTKDGGTQYPLDHVQSSSLRMMEESNNSSSILDSSDSLYKESYLDFINFNNDGSLKFGNNSYLQLTLDFLNNDFECLEGAWTCLKPSNEHSSQQNNTNALLSRNHLYLKRRKPNVFITILTNFAIYVFNPSLRSINDYKLEYVIKLETIHYLKADLNFQGLTIVGFNKRDHIHLNTGSERLTHSLTSSIDRICAKINAPIPTVYVDRDMQEITLKKSISSDRYDEVKIHHFSTTFWQPAPLPSSNIYAKRPNSSSTLGVQPDIVGFLRYHRDSDTSSTEEGYFLLKNGILYCFEDSSKSKLIFYNKINSQTCTCCVLLDDLVVNGQKSVGLQIDFKNAHGSSSLFLTNSLYQSEIQSSDIEMELCEWKRSILQTLLRGPTEDSVVMEEFDDQDDGFTRFGYTLLANNHLYILDYTSEGFLFKPVFSIEISEVLDLHTYSMRLPPSQMQLSAISNGNDSLDLDDQANQKDSNVTFFHALYLQLERSVMPQDTSKNISKTDRANQENCAILYFLDLDERTKFLDCFTRLWQSLFQVPLHVRDLRESTDQKPNVSSVRSPSQWRRLRKSLESTIQGLNCWYLAASSLIAD